ncbi:MAG: rhomboid family intramembrane serine protease [Phycisphaerales bacterium]|nr:rhomboid family intramembrane serine protease [Phycisphaerales bacterium]
MGVHDRAYWKESSGPRFSSPSGPGAGQRWSVNTWLIVLCAAVFMIDGFLPKMPLETGLWWVKDAQSSVWVVETTDPTKMGSERGTLTLEPTVVQAVVPVQMGQEIQNQRIQGFPIYDAAGNEVAVAQGRMAKAFEYWFHFSTKQVLGNAQVWRLIGFQFLHADMFHLLFNMIGLYFFGPLVERYLGGKRYLAFYLLCGIFGALLYLVLNLGGYIASEAFGLHSVPGLLVNATGTPLIGASAGVFGVLMAGAFLAPNAKVLVFFLLPMRLATMAWLLVGFSIVSILFNLNNSGGEAAHLGGAAAGWWFIRHPESLHGLFDLAGRVDPTSKHFAGRHRPVPGREHAQVDRILDKISQQGLQSLTKKEKQILEQASRRDQDRSSS